MEVDEESQSPEHSTETEEVAQAEGETETLPKSRKNKRRTLPKPKVKLLKPLRRLPNLRRQPKEQKKKSNKPRKEQVRAMYKGCPPKPNKQRKGTVVSNIPTRTNPSRRAKESTTPAVHQTKEVTSKTSPKAKRKMDFSREAEEPVGRDDQAKGALGDQPSMEIDKETQQRKKDEGRMIESTEDAAEDIKEQEEDDMGRESQLEMANELEEERAELTRIKKGKGKELPKPRTKGVMRKGGPTIQE